MWSECDDVLVQHRTTEISMFDNDYTVGEAHLLIFP